MSYYVDSTSFSKKILLNGADPSHTKDLRKLGGVFNHYIDTGAHGWVFSMSKEALVKNYINSGTLTACKQKGKRNLLDNPQRSSVGLCKVCKAGTTLETAVKSCIRYYTGGLPLKLTSELLTKEYSRKISLELGAGEYVCVNCK